MTKSPPPRKAYRDADFIGRPEARTLRILAEYLEPESRLERYKIRDTIVFFGSARIQPRDIAEARLDQAVKGSREETEARRARQMSRYYEDTRLLAYRLTEWSRGLEGVDQRFVVCSGGGPGIMEAANRGASEAKGDSIGLNISLPHEQEGNPYITPKLAFDFHYFFMRKYWFVYLAKALVVMPGGFGTLDEMMEVLTLVQTGKVTKPLPVVLYGSDYWDTVVDFDAMIRFGTISPRDMDLFHRADSVDDAFDYITSQLIKHFISDAGGDA